MLQKMRENFTIQIRKDAREEIFQRKRNTFQRHQVEMDSGTQEYTPNEMIELIYQTYLEQDFEQLVIQLKQYSDRYIKILEIFIRQEGDQNHQSMLAQFIQHINSKGAVLFLDIIKLGDVPSEFNVPNARLNCVNQVLVILINFSYLNGNNITKNLLDNGILSALLDDVFGRINKKEKLYLNFDKWSQIFESVCQILINLILDQENTNLLAMKEIILNSPLIKIWQFIYTKNMCSKSWKIVIQLERLLFKTPSIVEIETISQNSLKMIQQCTHLIDQTEMEDETYEQVLELLLHLSNYQVSTTLTLTRSVWEKIIKISKFPILYFPIFLNFTSLRCEDFHTEQFLIKIGLIKNMILYLENLNVEHLLIEKIYKCFNNIIFYRNVTLVNFIIQDFIPRMHFYIDQRIPQKQAVLEEYFILLKNTIACQDLSHENRVVIFSQLDVMKYVQQILLNNSYFLKMLAQLFYKLDTLPLEFKYLILQKVEQYQIIQIINKIASSQNCDEEGCMEVIFELLQCWESDTNQFNYM